MNKKTLPEEFMMAKDFHNACRIPDDLGYEEMPEDNFLTAPDRPNGKPTLRNIDLIDWISENHYIENINEEIYAFDGIKWVLFPDEQVETFIFDALPVQFRRKNMSNEIIFGIKRTKNHVKKDPASKILNFPNGLLTDSQNPFTFVENDGKGSTAGFFPFNVLAFEYDIEAKAPRWEQFVQELVYGKDEPQKTKEIIQMWLGGIMTNHSLQRCCLWLHGLQGKNGKGTITELFTDMFKGYSKPSTLAEFEHRFGLVNIQDKKLLMIPEVGKKSRLNDDRFKAVISGDTIMVEQKNGGMIDVRSHAKLLVCSNWLPDLDAVDHSMYDRIRLILLNNSYVGREDNNLPGDLRKEMPGIFNWIMDGLAMLKSNNFIVPETVEMKECKDLWFNREDTVWAYMQTFGWLNSDILKPMFKGTDEKEQIEWKFIGPELWKDYNAFCEQDHIRISPKRQNFFDSVLANIGCGKLDNGTANKTEFQEISKFLRASNLLEADGLRLDQDAVKIWASKETSFFKEASESKGLRY